MGTHLRRSHRDPRPFDAARLRPLDEAAHRLRRKPGWSLDVDLVGTPLADAPFAKVAVDRSETDWLFCEVKDRVFQGSGGPENLAELIDCFLRWQQAHAPAPR